MTDPTKSHTIRIFDKPFTVTCSPEEEAALFKSAEFLDKHMRQIRKSGRVIGLERIAIMAALNIANELLEQNNNNDNYLDNMNSRIKNLQNKIDTVLGDNELI